MNRKLNCEIELQQRITKMNRKLNHGNESRKEIEINYKNESQIELK